MKKQLKAKGFKTYAAYVRACAAGNSIFDVRHMGQTRRYAQNGIRYALKEHNLSLHTLNSCVTRVTIC